MVACAVFVLSVLSAPPARAQDGGRFEGAVVVEWLDDPAKPDREMRVLQEFGFRDARGKSWVVPPGAVIDGASIPPVFWSAVGPPFVGDYRKASVIHDHYCTTRSETWQATHRVFYDGLIAAGIPTPAAKILYGAVYGGGPRWSRIAGAVPGSEQVVTVVPEFTDEDFERLRALVEAEDPELRAIEAAVDRMVRE